MFFTSPRRGNVRMTETTDRMMEDQRQRAATTQVFSEEPAVTLFKSDVTSFSSFSSTSTGGKRSPSMEDNLDVSSAEDDKSSIQKHHEKSQRLHTVKKHHCTKCGKNFSDRWILKQHQFIHAREKPYVCAECGKSFTVQSNLKQHMCIHIGEKPYVCTECGKSYTVQSSLRQHLFSHARERPYVCTKCGKSFIAQSSFKKHQYIHNGQKPYVCTKCGKSFNDRSNLNRHQHLNCKNPMSLTAADHPSFTE
ncbi:gastrula zinc finger protein XlCGF7.1-like [Cynoglossus semilaevis]|uniref:gastrula zinc finger protein XlCGF7.1-like n=1 Tax=Cynoglossus semilaevis TaxID=244447 RepID=UPI000D62C3BA|nr:gastrula zinc finger protein XlCGF7.1-like [Cynoglossus semilaevis]